LIYSTRNVIKAINFLNEFEIVSLDFAIRITI